MKVSYNFSVLRYVHDPVTQEFVNIGVAVLARDARYLRARCTTNYGRVSHLFGKIDGQRFRQIVRQIEDQIGEAGRRYQAQLALEAERSLDQFLARILPPDDSAFQFSAPGVGVSSDLDRTLNELFQRYAERYVAIAEGEHRTDEEVWRSFREPLDRASVSPHLRPKRIVAPSYEYDFKHAWKNEIYHLYEPVSFDLTDAVQIVEKANRWLGRATSLGDSPEPFELHLLLGSPRDSSRRDAFIKAQNILNKIPVKKAMIHESEAEAFAEELAQQIKRHPDEAGE